MKPQRGRPVPPDHRPSGTAVSLSYQHDWSCPWWEGGDCDCEAQVVEVVRVPAGCQSPKANGDVVS
jgi:hypothetical protein